MGVRSISVRTRLLLLVVGLATLASLAIGAAYLATENERLGLQSEARAVTGMFDEANQLSAGIRDQESAIDDYLLSRNSDAVVRYRGAVQTELSLTARLGIESQGANLPDLTASLDALTQQTNKWRNDVAEPAIAAVVSGSDTAIAAVVSAVAHDQESTIARIDDVIARLGSAQADIGAREDQLAQLRAISGGVGIGLMLIGALSSVFLVRRWVVRPLDKLLATATDVQAGRDSAFVAVRDDEIGRLGAALEQMRLSLRTDAARSDVLNRFTEVTTFSPDDASVAESNLEALRLLVQPDAGVTHVLNQSKDRAVPEASIGSAIVEVLPLNTLSRCPGIVRGGIYVTPDVTAPLSVHCPVYPAERGTLACIPLAHGEVVGSVHLVWDRTDAFPLELRSSVSRVAEHAALAIANRRLLSALRGMASTDARTGLPNTRAFDQAVEDALAARVGDEKVSVLMLDIDHFKDFNDRHGHPAGDEALRSFADILRSCIREGDLAARYGGEEFAVVVSSGDDDTALVIAERIRSRTESAVISLAPGITDRMSVSIGVASAPLDALDRVSLLRRADEALYRAKQSGRNRVAHDRGEVAQTAKRANGKLQDLSTTG
jgi:diguanylate cyclase (GGDEF)-like protein